MVPEIDVHAQPSFLAVGCRKDIPSPGAAGKGWAHRRTARRSVAAAGLLGDAAFCCIAVALVMIY
jgi:hypothetical protein